MIPMDNSLHLRGDVKDVQFLGEIVQVTCKVGADHVIVAHIRRSEFVGKRIDETMDLYVAATDCALVADDRS
jgi:hypothetical protein